MHSLGPATCSIGGRSRHFVLNEIQKVLFFYFCLLNNYTHSKEVLFVYFCVLYILKYIIYNIYKYNLFGPGEKFEVTAPFKLWSGGPKASLDQQYMVDQPAATSRSGDGWLRSGDSQKLLHWSHTFTCKALLVALISSICFSKSTEQLFCPIRKQQRQMKKNGRNTKTNQNAYATPKTNASANAN